MSELYYKRPVLAKKLAAQVLNTSPTSGARSGVFLAAPRRTGKSTFMREDFREELGSQGALVLYADLWQDKAKNPGEVINEAVRNELGRNDGALKRLAKAIGVNTLNVTAGPASLKLDITKVGTPEGSSLASALAALSDEVSKPIVLIIDEAQHAITTKDGENALFALKAARDELNSTAHNGLRIVATGSNRNKLAMLINSKDQAFFGATLVDFPPLDKGFVEWFCNHSNIDGLDLNQVQSLFEKAGYRPEILFGAADTVGFSLTPTDLSPMQQFENAVKEQIERANSDKLPVIQSLTPLQKAVLRVMAHMGKEFAPFEAATMTYYAAAMNDAGAADVKPDSNGVQQALQALQEKGLVWRAQRGVYDLEEASISNLLSKVHAIDSAKASDITSTKSDGLNMG